jgi:GT2 family glycosyltransferase
VTPGDPTAAARCPSTIVIAPREAHSVWRAMLARLYATTEPPFRVVAVDGGSPRSVRTELERLAAAHDFTLIRADAELSGNEARNLAAPHVHTEFVVLLDNDTLVEPGWLPALEQRARETGAAAVGPAVLWGRDDAWEIHFAGGVSALADDGRSRRYEERNSFIHRPVEELTTLTVAPTSYLELHALLLRGDVFDALVPFDERYVGARDHADMWLAIAARGEVACVDPVVVVRYPRARLRPTDYRFYLPRWSDAWAERSFRAFNAAHGITDDGIDDVFRAGHRRRRFEGAWGWPQGRTLGARGARKAIRAVDAIATPAAVWRSDRRRARAGAARVAHAASWDRGG